MSKRTKAATVDIGLRVKEPMRARIEQAAKDRGVSMNGEINDRLEASFTKEELFDKFFGGPEMRQMAMLWAAAFAHAARLGEGSKSISKKDTDPDTDSFREGALAVVRALTVGMSPEAERLFFESAKGRFLTRVVNARLKAKS